MGLKSGHLLPGIYLDVLVSNVEKGMVIGLYWISTNSFLYSLSFLFLANNFLSIDYCVLTTLLLYPGVFHSTLFVHHCYLS